MTVELKDLSEANFDSKLTECVLKLSQVNFANFLVLKLVCDHECTTHLDRLFNAF